jgi:4-amino-4-deoxy-L-arabinose transferase-like glycosyltransferase
VTSPSVDAPIGRIPSPRQPAEAAAVLPEAAPASLDSSTAQSSPPPPSPRLPFTTRLATWFVEHAALFAVLVLQIVMSYRLQNSAFQDEALYLYAGHREIAELLHHTPTYDNYATYFSGAPFLYPVVGAAVDGVFGLAGARMLSLAFMMAATCLVWSTTRILYGRYAAACAAALFAVAAPTLFLDRLATYDAPALFLLAVAFRTVVRTARSNPLAVLLAVPPTVLAVGTKYASLLYVPTLVIVAILVGRFRGKTHTRRWLNALGRGVLFAGAVAGLLYGWLEWLGPAFRAGISSTTTSRAAGTDSLPSIAQHAAEYGAGVFALAVAGAAVDLVRTRRSGAGRGALAAAVALSGTLTATALLAPAYQMHLHTLTSLQKHVGFGLLFAAPVGGVFLAALLRVGSRDPRRLGLALVVFLSLMAAALSQSSTLYRQWPGTTALIEAVRTQVRPVTGRYLAEEDEVPRYYTRDLTEPYQWFGTYTFTYTDKQGKTLTGVPAYQAAIADRYFQLIILRYGPTASLDLQIDPPLKAQKGYTLIDVIPADSSYGTGDYYIWRAN